jgi:hypothetical protein
VANTDDQAARVADELQRLAKFALAVSYSYRLDAAVDWTFDNLANNGDVLK